MSIKRADLQEAVQLHEALGEVETFIRGAQGLDSKFATRVSFGSYECDVELQDVLDAVHNKRVRLITRLNELGVALE